ncbi:recombinase family protein [Catenovulum sp. SX2]|uniref:recombinase family protein n=1 Tax=Catenovulum sp. SX2 TaxID=3398614 RepID=UPI003F82A617
MKRKVYAYQRFSSDAQRGNSSLHRQSEQLKSWLSRHPDCELAEEIVDEAMSAYTGKNVSTGALGEFIARMEAGLIEPKSIVLIEHFSRLTRQDIDEAEGLLKKLWNYGVSVAITKKDKIYDPDAVNDLVGRIELILEIKAAFEDSEYRSRKVKGSYVRREEDAKKGITPKLRRPFWLEQDGSCNQHKCILQDIFKLYLSGQGQRNILKAIKEKYPDVSFLDTTNPSTLMDWISMESVIGMWRGYKVYEAAIDEATYYQAQDVREKRQYKNVKPDSEWPLSGLIRCRGCGCGMSIQRTFNKKTQRYSLPILRCSNTQRKGERAPECTTERTFPLVVAHYFYFEHSRNTILERLTKSEVNKERLQQESVLNRELSKLVAKRDNYQAVSDEAEGAGDDAAVRNAFKYILAVDQEIEDRRQQLQELKKESYIESAELILPDMIDLLEDPKNFNITMHRLQLYAYLDGTKLYFDEGKNFEYTGFDRKHKNYVVNCDGYPVPTLEISNTYYSEENLFYPLTKMTYGDIAYWKHAVEIQNLRKTKPAEAFKEVDQKAEQLIDDLFTNFDNKIKEIDDAHQKTKSKYGFN